MMAKGRLDSFGGLTQADPVILSGGHSPESKDLKHFSEELCFDRMTTEIFLPEAAVQILRLRALRFAQNDNGRSLTGSAIE